MGLCILTGKNDGNGIKVSDVPVLTVGTVTQKPCGSADMEKTKYEEARPPPHLRSFARCKDTAKGKRAPERTTGCVA